MLSISQTSIKRKENVILKIIKRKITTLSPQIYSECMIFDNLVYILFFILFLPSRHRSNNGHSEQLGFLALQ